MTTDDFKPGSFGCHEALHVVFVIAEMVDTRLCRHPAIVRNPEWLAISERACTTLFDLYDAIAREHL